MRRMVVQLTKPQNILASEQGKTTACGLVPVLAATFHAQCAWTMGRDYGPIQKHPTTVEYTTLKEVIFTSACLTQALPAWPSDHVA